MEIYEIRHTHRGLVAHQIIDNESHDVRPPRETFHFFTSEFYEDSLHHFV